MPTVYEAALLANYVYNPDENPLPTGWKVLFQTQQVGGVFIKGYRAALLINDSKKEAVISHRGTKITSCPDSTHNATDDTIIVSRGVPESYLLAEKFTQECIGRLPAGFACTQVGHSLGGFHAHMCGYSTRMPVIAFEPILHEVQLKRVFEEPLDTVQVNKHHSYFIAPNVINMIHSYPGHQYQNNLPAF